MDRNANEFLRYLETEFGGRFPTDAYERLNAQRTKAVNRSLSLSRAEDLSPVNAASIIRVATNDKIGRIIAVSGQKPPAAGTLAADELYRLKTGLKIGEGLADRLSRGHGHAIREALAEDRRQELRRRLNECLGDGLWEAFSNSLPQGSWLKPMRAALYDNLWYALYFYLASLAAGLDERAERLRGLAKLVNYALPLCRRDESDEWLLVVR